MTGFRFWMLIPALGAIAVLMVFMMGLQRDDVQRLPSALIGKPAPEFDLAGLSGTDGLRTNDLKGGGVKLLNVWASWCGPCRIEHPNIEALAQEGLTIHGLNYKDDPENASAFLRELGNPYRRIGSDKSGRVGIDFGVYGVPETFVIDNDGEIVFKHVGPVLSSNIDRLRQAIRDAGGNP